jgi:amidase
MPCRKGTATRIVLRHFRILFVIAPIVVLGCAFSDEIQPRFDVVEATIPEMQTAMASGRLTAEELAGEYLDRIALYEDELNAAIAVNPNALAHARVLDLERAQGTLRGPLHGIPIALKDNIHTTEMPTTGGALAFEGFVPPYEATLTRNLREAGAIIIAKTVLTELANWVASPATPMPANYSALGGYGLNPYDPRIDPRIADGRGILSPGGSSSGIGTAANLWAASVGTETLGSILFPSNMTMLVGIKPTVGRISRYGIIPIAADQDTAGPMARTVTDAAILLGALEGESDPMDPATGRCAPPPDNYTTFLDANGLEGARIGIPRTFYYAPMPEPSGDGMIGGMDPQRSDLMERAIDVLGRQGAVVVDPVEIPSIRDPDPERNAATFGICVVGKGEDESCSVVLKYGMKRDFNAWLETLGDSAPVRSLTDLREWNVEHAALNAIRYGQGMLDISDEMDVEADRNRYEADRARDVEMTRERGIDAVLEAYDLDALLFPGNLTLGSAAGYPVVTVPFGTVTDGLTIGPQSELVALRAPMGVNFTGGACSEPELIALAYAFEQATLGRIPPESTP